MGDRRRYEQRFSSDNDAGNSTGNKAARNARDTVVRGADVSGSFEGVLQADLSRRDLLRIGAGAALVAGLPACGPLDEGTDEGVCEPEGVDESSVRVTNPDRLARNDAVFDRAVMSGAVTTSSVLITGHVAADEAVRLKAWRGKPGQDEVDVVSDIEVMPVEGYLRARLEGLSPATEYHYAFIHDGDEPVRSGIGRFRTAYPEGCKRPLTVGATACTDLRNAPFRALELTVEEDVDVLCHLGDMSYNDGARTQADFRANWLETMREPTYRRFLSSAATYITWDDHEIVDNGSLYTISPDVIAAGKDAFFEALPVERGENDRLWRSHSWGDTAEFFILDSRLERKPETRLQADATYLGKEQFAWLKAALGASKAHFKIVLNSVPITRFPMPPWAMTDDRWQGYPAQRDELLDFITSNDIENVWWLSGDFHVGAVAKLEATGPRSRMREILCGPGGNGGNPLGMVYEVVEEEREGIAPSNQFDHFSGRIAATLLTFDPIEDSVRVRFIDAETEKVVFDRTYRPEE